MKNIAATPPKIAPRTPIKTAIVPVSVESIDVPEPVDGFACAASNLSFARMLF
jgi:hypothetical protein